MMFSAASGRALLVSLACLLLGGCDAFFGGSDDDAKNALLAEARVRRDQFDYPGAVAILEKALEANPRLVRAHWDLGLICYQNTRDYAAAIYHLQKLLKLAPAWKQADDARRIIDDCKLELAKTAPFGPDTPEGQRLLSGLTVQLHKLSDDYSKLKSNFTALTVTNNQLQIENYRLLEAIQRLQAAAQLPAGRPSPPYSNASSSTQARPTAGGVTPPSTPSQFAQTRPPPSPGSQPSGAADAAVSPRPGPANAPGTRGATLPVVQKPQAAAPRTYQVRSGDTLAAIARRYAVTVSDLMRVNPSLEPRRLRPGQTVRLP